MKITTPINYVPSYNPNSNTNNHSNNTSKIQDHIESVSLTIINYVYLSDLLI